MLSSPQSRTTRVRPAVSTLELDVLRVLFHEYAASISVDLAFQNFDQELATLPGPYESARGCLLLAQVDGIWAGCCALRPLDTVDYPNAAEMKRLFVREHFRRLGIGRLLTESVLDEARARAYNCVLLDTLDDMESARALYQELGFEEIPPYYFNPIAGAHYLKVAL
jgi:putative acetyltransferase